MVHRCEGSTRRLNSDALAVYILASVPWRLVCFGSACLGSRTGVPNSTHPATQSLGLLFGVILLSTGPLLDPHDI